MGDVAECRSVYIQRAPPACRYITLHGPGGGGGGLRRRRWGGGGGGVSARKGSEVPLFIEIPLFFITFWIS